MSQTTETARDRYQREADETRLRAVMFDICGAARSAFWHVERDVELGSPDEVIWMAERMLLLADKELARAQALYDEHLSLPASAPSSRAYECQRQLAERLVAIKRYADAAQLASVAIYADDEDDDAPYDDPTTVMVDLTVRAAPDSPIIDARLAGKEGQRLRLRFPELDEPARRMILCEQIARRWVRGASEQARDWSILRRREGDAADIIRFEVEVEGEDATAAAAKIQQLMDTYLEARRPSVIYQSANAKPGEDE